MITNMDAASVDENQTRPSFKLRGRDASTNNSASDATKNHATYVFSTIQYSSDDTAPHTAIATIINSAE